MYYNTKEGKSCVIYIRVSSERQVKGYSLDGQKHYLAECAERRGMTVLDTYVEEGKSGKSIEGRTEFQRMMDDIQSGKVHTDYVLVFKLSRFGRNARDVLNSLEFIMKYGVHLMCVEDGLDSSTSMGKMMITILGAVSALQRSRDSLERDIDRIAPDDKYAERRRADMTRRLNDLYDQIYKAEDAMSETQDVNLVLSCARRYFAGEQTTESVWEIMSDKPAKVVKDISEYIH